MKNVHWSHELPRELTEVEDRLRDNRPVPTDAEAARIRLAVEVEMAHMEAPARPKRSNKVLLRSRVAITSMFVTGFLMAGSGAGLAISGISSSGSAGVAQYPTTTTGTVTSSTPVNTQQQGPQVLGTTETTPTVATEPTTSTTTKTQPEVLGTTAQTPRQVSVKGAVKELPFTGIAAIPIILVGLAFLMAGVLLRRSRLSADQS